MKKLFAIAAIAASLSGCVAFGHLRIHSQEPRGQRNGRQNEQRGDQRDSPRDDRRLNSYPMQGQR
jgi:hypothetical protein